MDTESELLRRIKHLDADALAETFDMYYDSIYSYIYYRVHHVQTAEDLTAKVFQRLLQHLHSGNGPDRNLRAWLFRVAYNLIVDDSRRQTHRNHDPLLETMPASNHNIEEFIVTNQLIEKVYFALSTLTDKQQHVILLRYLIGMTPTEIANVLDVTVGSVKALQHRGLERLRNEMELQQGDTGNGR